MKSYFLFYLICLFSFSFINISAKSQHFDMTVFSSLLSMTQVFNKSNLTSEIIPKLTEKGIEKAKKYISKRISGKTPYKKEEEPNTCSFEGKLIHAKVTAEENMLRDKNATDFGSEFLYMYMSHYIDIPVQHQGSCSENDELPFYANWITNNDRYEYLDFFNDKKIREIVDKIRNITSYIKSFVEGGLDTIQESYFLTHSIDKVKDNIEDFLKDQAKELLSGKTPKEIIQGRIGELTEYFEKSELSEDDIIKKVEESLGKDVLSKYLEENLFDFIDAIIDVSVGGIHLFSAITTMLNAPLIIFTSDPKTFSLVQFFLLRRLEERAERALLYEINKK